MAQPPPFNVLNLLCRKSPGRSLLQTRTISGLLMADGTGTHTPSKNRQAPFGR